MITININVKVRRIHEDAVLPYYASEGAAAFDLVATEDVIIEPGETALVPIGLSFEIPVGYVMDIRDRSGIAKNTKLRVANSTGTVDSDFRGEVNVIMDNELSDYGDVSWSIVTLDGEVIVWDIGITYPVGTYLIRKGDRVAQALIQRIPHVTFTEENELSETVRGTGGFGSTGTTITL